MSYIAYLQPLIDELKRLWSGFGTYDIAQKLNFVMGATLMWYIKDFLVYGLFFGWDTHGKFTCLICMEDT
jgi:hypothetical protein